MGVFVIIFYRIFKKMSHTACINIWHLCL